MNLHGPCLVPLLEKEIGLAIGSHASFSGTCLPLSLGSPSHHRVLAGHKGTCSLAMSGVVTKSPRAPFS